MKKIMLLLLLFLLILTSCSDDKNINGDSTNSVSNNNNEAENQEASIDIWDIEPIYEFDDIDVDFVGGGTGANNEGNGNYYGHYGCYINQLDAYGNYEKGGLVFEKDGLYGFVNSNGQIVTNAEYDDYCLISDILWVSNNLGGSDIVEEKYTVQFTGQGIGAFFTPKLCWDINGYPTYDLDVDDGQVRSFYPNEVVGGKVDIIELFREEGLLKDSNEFVLVSKAYCNHKYTNNTKDCVVYFDGSNYEILENIPYDKYYYLFSNDVVFCYDTEFDEKMICKNFEYYDVKNGTSIRGYDSGYPFFEEYAAVKMNDKWGYIDKQGNVLIDFVFDKATPLCDGKAWVIYNGKTGRLNIKDMLDNKVPFNDDVLNSSTYQIETQ